MLATDLHLDEHGRVMSCADNHVSSTIVANRGCWIHIQIKCRMSNMLVLVLTVLLSVSSGWAKETESVIVKLAGEGGQVSGVSFPSTEGGPIYYAFRGIPYAKPPTGNLRFKAPQPYGNIEGTLKADKDGPSCPQIDAENDIVIGEEDCLKLNVYSHQKPQTKEIGALKFPVVVIFHDGGFERGSSSFATHNPRRFLDKEIVVVTLNYRLGVLGFLSLNDDISPGNYGLLDQVEALRWVQKNIGAFGGDVHQVTLFGLEAGAASALYHLLSPLSKGLFQRIISIGGSATCDASIQKNSKEWANKLGEKLDCYVHDSKALINCLRKRSNEEIVLKAHKLHTLNNRFPATFLPCVERVFKENGDFLPDTPINLIKEGKINKVPVILGVKTQEGKRLFKDLISDNDLKDKESFFTKSLPDILQSTTHIKFHHSDISDAIRQIYYQPSDSLDNEQFEKITPQVFDDYMVASCVEQTAKHLSKSGWPTYVYSVDIQDADEKHYLFEPVNGKISEEEMKVRRIILNLWANFIKTSMPTPNKSLDLPVTWMPLNPGKMRYLSVSSNSTMIESSVNKFVSFWLNRVPKIESGLHKKEEL